MINFNQIDASINLILFPIVLNYIDDKNYRYRCNFLKLNELQTNSVSSTQRQRLQCFRVSTTEVTTS